MRRDTLYRRRLRFKIAIVAVTASLIVAGSARAAGTLDQSQTGTYNSYGTIFTDRWWAQTFTAGISGGLDQVDLDLGVTDECPVAGSLTVEIQTASMGSPSGTVLAGATVAETAVGASPAFISIPFSSPAKVRSGTQYAIVASAPSAQGICPGVPGAGIQRYTWAATSGDPYPGGQMLASFNSGGIWASQGDLDSRFKTYVDEPPETAITKGPISGKTHDRTPTFKFRSSEPGSKFKCSLDRARFRSCSSPDTLHKLSFGKHTLRVKATDPAHNTDRTPAHAAFKVVH